MKKLQARIAEQEEEIQLLTTELQKHKIVIENLKPQFRRVKQEKPRQRRKNFKNRRRKERSLLCNW